MLEYTRATMPESYPDLLSDQEYIDIIVYMLSYGKMPAGEVELQADPQNLARTIVRQKPAE